VNKEAPTDDLLRRITSRAKKLGQFYVFKDSKDVWSIRFSAHFNATEVKVSITPNDPLAITLKDIIYFVNQVGEETDRELNGDKDIK